MDPTTLKLDWLNKAIDYTQAIIARLSGLLLMLGLVAAMANLLTDGNVLDHSGFLQQGWAWVQAIAVDANLWLLCVRSVNAIREKNKFKSVVYVGVSLLLVFVAIDVTALESLKQALNTSLGVAASYTYIPIPYLTIVRSFVVVALVFVSGLEVMNHQTKQVESTKPSKQNTLNATEPRDYTEHIAALSSELPNLAPYTPDTQQFSTEPFSELGASNETISEPDSKQAKIWEVLAINPDTPVSELMKVCKVSKGYASEQRKRYHAAHANGHVNPPLERPASA